MISSYSSHDKEKEQCLLLCIVLNLGISKLSSLPSSNVFEIQLFCYFYGGLVHGNTGLPLSDILESRTSVSREPCNVYRRDLYRFVGENLHIPMISIS